MNRTILDRQLGELKAAVTGLGEEVESALVQSLAALETGARLTTSVPCGVDQLRRDRHRIDSLAALVITLHQPTLGDLRAALGAMSTASELEQIGNLALKVAARSADEMESASSMEPLARALVMLARVAHRQVQAALAAYDTSNVAAAVAVWRGDVDVDYLYSTIVSSCKTALRVESAPVWAGTAMLAIAHDLERIADHAASIGERVTYIASGDPAVADVPEHAGAVAERSDGETKMPAPSKREESARTANIPLTGPVPAVVRLRTMLYNAFHSVRDLVTSADSTPRMIADVHKGL